MEKDEVEELLIGLILEGKVEGRIDQVGMRLELDRQYVSIFSFPLYSLLGYVCVLLATNFTPPCSSQSLEKRRYIALQKWTDALDTLHSAVVSKSAGSSGDPRFMSMPLMQDFDR